MNPPHIAIDLGLLGVGEKVGSIVRNGVRQKSARLFATSKKNLLFSVSKLVSSRLSILLLRRKEGAGSATQYRLANGEIVSNSELQAALDETRGAAMCIFIVSDEEVSESRAMWLANSLCDRCMVVEIKSDFLRFAIAAIVEMYNWHGKKSIFKEEISLEYFSIVAKRLLASLQNVGKKEAQFAIGLHDPSVQALWESSLAIDPEADVEKFRENARSEQRLDALKRISDISRAPRHCGLAPLEFGRSYQGTFWMCELPAGEIDFDWLASSSLANALELPPPKPDWPALVDLSVSERAERWIIKLFEQFCEIRPGKFVVGIDEGSDRSEPPAIQGVHQSSGFLIQRAPVTIQDWAFLSGDDCSECDRIPATGMNLLEALAYANSVESYARKLGLIEEDQSVSIPSEYDWEVAARGSESTLFPWGNSFDAARCNCLESGIGGPTSVTKYGRIGQSEFGVFDMAGNVREWTSSLCGALGVRERNHHSQYDVSYGGNLNLTARAIIRGGSYSYDFECVQAWVRNTQIVTRRDMQTGFRIALYKNSKSDE